MYPGSKPANLIDCKRYRAPKILRLPFLSKTTGAICRKSAARSKLFFVLIIQVRITFRTHLLHNPSVRNTEIVSPWRVCALALAHHHRQQAICNFNLRRAHFVPGSCGCCWILLQWTLCVCFLGPSEYSQGPHTPIPAPYMPWGYEHSRFRRR